METMLFGELLDIMRRLRGENGCPWDKKQTIESIKPFLIEECYEVIDAIEGGDADKISEELGDLLYQIVFMAQIAEEKGNFDMGQVLSTISGKMIRRHPHVFSDEKVRDVSDVLAKWEEIKQKEQCQDSQERISSVLDGLPKGLPSLVHAHRVQEKAARVGFDWAGLDEVVEKLDEEVSEFKEAIKTGNLDACESEYGDLLFTMVNISRFMGFDPEGALRKATKRFSERFRLMEKRVLEKGQALRDLDLEEMDRLWEAVKEEIS